ncbi:MAG TPA: DUF3179 domain-containing (seleno)protein, partial [Burkholderiales bacterium]|nr:DUF3179 domain-containing (seleno)protein [Burkholderiales bacterium]
MPHDLLPDPPQRRPRPSGEPGQDIVRRKRRDEQGGLPPWYAPLPAPRWVRSEEATHMRPEDPVLCLALNGGAWALPWWVMKNHHVANLELNGKAVLVTLCEMCTSSGAFDPVIDGRRRLFRLEGIYNGTIMPTDDETGSLWTGFTGESFEGPLKGTVMPRLPLVQCTWEEWSGLHPDTLVADGEGEPRDGHGEGHTPGSPALFPGMRGLLSNVDQRLHHYELVLGVFAGGAARCYPLSALALHGPALNDALGGEEIAVFCLPGSWIAIAY